MGWSRLIVPKTFHEDIFMRTGIFNNNSLYPTWRKLKHVYTSFTSSVVCPFVHLSMEKILSTLYLSHYQLDSMSYLYISSSNFRKCVACKVFFICKNSKIWTLGNLKTIGNWLCLVLSLYLIWINHMGNHEVVVGVPGGNSQNTGNSSCF